VRAREQIRAVNQRRDLRLQESHARRVFLLFGLFVKKIEQLHRAFADHRNRRVLVRGCSQPFERTVVHVDVGGIVDADGQDQFHVLLGDRVEAGHRPR